MGLIILIIAFCVFAIYINNQNTKTIKPIKKEIVKNGWIEQSAIPGLINAWYLFENNVKLGSVFYVFWNPSYCLAEALYNDKKEIEKLIINDEQAKTWVENKLKMMGKC